MSFQIVDVKMLYNTALKSAPAYHRDRRLFISQLLKDYWLIFRECPGNHCFIIYYALPLTNYCNS
jgi:hypothetical protein